MRTPALCWAASPAVRTASMPEGVGHHAWMLTGSDGLSCEPLRCRKALGTRGKVSELNQYRCANRFDAGRRWAPRLDVDRFGRAFVRTASMPEGVGHRGAPRPFAEGTPVRTASMPEGVGHSGVRSKRAKRQIVSSANRFDAGRRWALVGSERN